MIEARFYFRKFELIIIVVYIPPNNKEVAKKIQQKVVTKFFGAFYQCTFYSNG